MTGWLRYLIDLPPLLSILLKTTVVLALGWGLHFALSRSNPRWRVLVWRGVLVGVVVIPLLQPLAGLGISVTTGSVQGQVWIGDRPAANAGVVYDRYAPEVGPASQHPVQTDSEGRFQVDDLPPGKYRFARLVMWDQRIDGVTTSKGTGSHGTPVEVEAGKTANVKIGGGGRTVTGRFIFEENAEGETVSLDATERRYLTAKHRRGDGFPGRHLVLDIDDDGSFEILDVWPAYYTLDLSVRDSADNPVGRELRTDPKVFDIPRGASEEDRTPFDLGDIEVRHYSPGEATEETRMGRVEGRVMIGKHPAPGERVLYYRFFPEDGPRDDDRDPVTTNADGAFKIENLPPGKYRFQRLIMYSLRAEGGCTNGGTGTHTVEVEVKPDETTQVQVGGTGREVRGRLVSVPNAKGEQLSPISLTRRHMLLVDEKTGETSFPKVVLYIRSDGTFMIPDVLPGRWRTEFNASMKVTDIDGRPVRCSPNFLDIPPGDPADDPYDVGDIEISLFEE
jgi:hypothetical protein